LAAAATTAMVHSSALAAWATTGAVRLVVCTPITCISPAALHTLEATTGRKESLSAALRISCALKLNQGAKVYPVKVFLFHRAHCIIYPVKL